MADFGGGLGAVIGGAEASSDLDAGQKAVDNISGTFGSQTAAYNNFGQSFLNPATSQIGAATQFGTQTQGYEDFMKNYSASPGAQYAVQQGQEAQNNSAASTGQLLSGTNERALSGITQNISNQYANQAYSSYLQGNNQQFGQLESALGNMFSAIGVGTTATGQQAGVDQSQIGATSQIAQAQAKNDQSKGSGLGSMFGGLGSLAAAF